MSTAANLTGVLAWPTAPACDSSLRRSAFAGLPRVQWRPAADFCTVRGWDWWVFAASSGRHARGPIDAASARAVITRGKPTNRPDRDPHHTAVGFAHRGAGAPPRRRLRRGGRVRANGAGGANRDMFCRDWRGFGGAAWWAGWMGRGPAEPKPRSSVMAQLLRVSRGHEPLAIELVGPGLVPSGVAARLPKERQAGVGIGGRGRSAGQACESEARNRLPCRRRRALRHAQGKLRDTMRARGCARVDDSVRLRHPLRGGRVRQRMARPLPLGDQPVVAQRRRGRAAGRWPWRGGRAGLVRAFAGTSVEPSRGSAQ